MGHGLRTSHKVKMCLLAETGSEEPFDRVVRFTPSKKATRRLPIGSIRIHVFHIVGNKKKNKEEQEQFFKGSLEKLKYARK